TVLADPVFDIQEAMGVNTQEQLAEVAEILQRESVE
ncbi:MAG TPA: glycosyl transferase family 2, partial [Planctomycetaceae bacterium]|nr:glycosyl transferase family 2 [Planctomycetaceae bacterium]